MTFFADSPTLTIFDADLPGEIHCFNCWLDSSVLRWIPLLLLQKTNTNNTNNNIHKFPHDHKQTLTNKVLYYSDEVITQIISTPKRITNIEIIYLN